MASAKQSTALTKRNASDALMAPPPAPKRIKRPSIVLDEDTYTSGIDHIIRRDFFPGLAETDAQREYLSAVESKDKSWIREAGKHLTQVMTPVPGGQRARRGVSMTPRPGLGGETPRKWVGDTPVTLAGTEDLDEEDEKEKKPEVDLVLSLNAFQAKYTSEDQESFSRLIDRRNKERFEANTWLHTGNKYASKQRIAQQKVLEAAKSTSTSQALVLRPSQDLDDRPAAPTTTKHIALNSLMFNPESVEDWAPTRAQHAEAASLAPPKTTVYQNTRLHPADTESGPPRPPSPTMSAVRDAISGRPRYLQSEAGYVDDETQFVKGYAMVTARTYEDEDDAPTDLLERYGANTGTNPFTIHDSNRREKLHYKMVDRINTKNSSSATSAAAASTAAASKTPANVTAFLNSIPMPTYTPRFLTGPTPRRMGLTPAAGTATTATSSKKNIGNLTPAAQRLFQSVGGSTPRETGSGGFGAKGKDDWTPIPSLRRRY